MVSIADAILGGFKPLACPSGGRPLGAHIPPDEHVLYHNARHFTTKIAPLPHHGGRIERRVVRSPTFLSNPFLSVVKVLSAYMCRSDAASGQG